MSITGCTFTENFAGVGGAVNIEPNDGTTNDGINLDLTDRTMTINILEPI